MKRHILGAGLAALVGAGTLVAAGCGASVNVGSLPLDQTFDECADGFSMNDEVSTVECTDGQLRILVSKPELSPMHNVPFRFDPSVEGLTVTSDVGLVKGRGDVGSAATPPARVSRLAGTSSSSIAPCDRWGSSGSSRSPSRTGEQRSRPRGWGSGG